MPQATDINSLPSSDGRAYRLDAKSGEVTVIEQGAMHKLSQAEQTPLIMGVLFKTEDGEIIRYIGQGKFEARKPLSDIFQK